MLIMKSKEWIIATKLEFMYSKKEILTMYANTVDFGSNAYGIKTACKTYFDTTPAEITTEQIAVLVGMLKATTLYNPRTNPDNSLRRRNASWIQMHWNANAALRSSAKLRLSNGMASRSTSPTHRVTPISAAKSNACSRWSMASSCSSMPPKVHSPKRDSFSKKHWLAV